EKKKKLKAQQVFTEPQPVEKIMPELVTLGFIAPAPYKEPYFYQFKKFIADSLKKSSFTIFPNPATPGGMLRTSFKAKKGSYFVQFLDANGFMVQEEKLEAWNEKMDIQLPISGRILPGVYTVMLIDDNRKKLGSQKLIVQ
ncbi:MAG TPA: T9SS type A sorting domain-containing protein, partial [Chitinophagaceae bacterium]|nr:T9SS type A sorting domain-containing protein [Chitinophagaceae bacterium]